MNSETKETTTSRGAQLAIFNNSKTSLPSALDPKTETASSQTTLPIAYNSERRAFNADCEEILLSLTYNPKGKTAIGQVSPLAAYNPSGREILLPLTYSRNSETIAGNFLESNIINRVYLFVAMRQFHPLTIYMDIPAERNWLSKERTGILTKLRPSRLHSRTSMK